MAVVRLDPADDIPTSWNQSGDFWSIVHTPDETSLVCDECAIPQNLVAEKGWRIFMVNGPLPFEMVGVLASLTQPMVRAGISIFAISTYDTDYILVKEEKVNLAIDVWQQAGHKITFKNL